MLPPTGVLMLSDAVLMKNAAGAPFGKRGREPWAPAPRPELCQRTNALKILKSGPQFLKVQFWLGRKH